MFPSSTPYDDAWRTITISASRLLIPMVNEVFGEHFSPGAAVTLTQNEHLFMSPDGSTQRRSTDASFSIAEHIPLLSDDPPSNGFEIQEGLVRKRYLVECESKPVTGSVLVRLAEYAVKTGMEEMEKESAPPGYRMILSIPRTAVLSLRSTRNTPEQFELMIRTEQGQIITAIPVVKLSDYNVDQIFEKHLYLLIPFLLFNYEKQFQTLQEDSTQLHAFLEQFQKIYVRIDESIPSEEDTTTFIDAFTSKLLQAATLTVANALTENYPNIKEGVNSVVGGKIIEFEALKIKREGLREGLEQGLEQGRKQGADGMLHAVTERMICNGTDGNIIQSATGFNRSQIDAIAKRLKTTVNWAEPAQA